MCLYYYAVESFSETELTLSVLDWFTNLLSY
jgi:hypothetical protein